jgi:hypothetical protein
VNEFDPVILIEDLPDQLIYDETVTKRVCDKS